VSLPIALISQGEENALGFSLDFSPAILTNAQAKLGKDAGSASLNLNTTQVSSGHLGIALAVPAGQAFAAGAREIVVVSFTINANTTVDSTRMEFGDQPIVREVVDANTNALFTAWSGGKVTITPPLALPSQVALLSPSHTAVLPSSNVKFTWRQSQPAISRYGFEIATDSSMANSVKDSTLKTADTTKVVLQLLNKQTYWWRVRAGNAAGWGPYSEQRRFRIDVPVSVEAPKDNPIPTEFSLLQNHPNPFNPSTTIKYDLPQQAEVKLEIFNLLGRHVRTLVSQTQQAGRYAITWDGRNEQGQALASGVYLYQLHVADPVKGGTGTFVQTRRMALVR